MPILSDNLADISILDAGIVALLGYAIVFVGLIALMAVVVLMGKAFTAALSKKPEPEAPAAEEPAVEQPTAPGVAGELKLHNVDPRTAAMIMAIVADKLQKPLNELRFISIKEAADV